MAEADENTSQEAQSEGQTTSNQPYPWLKNYPSHVPWESKFQPQSMSQMFDNSVERFSSNICTHFLGKTLTYAEIGAMTEKVAIGLQSLGVGKGTRVGLFLPNCPTFVIFYFAILKAGGTVVNYNPLYAIEELEYQVRDSGTDIMVTLDLKILFDKVERLLEGGTLSQAIVCPFSELLPSVKSLLFKGLKRGELAKPQASPQLSKILLLRHLTSTIGELAKPDIDPLNDVAVFQYTGGTTGTPKGAMLTHANLTVNLQQIIAWHTRLKPGEERIMGILPFFHVFAMTTVMNLGIALGAQLILIPKFELNQGMKTINAMKPTCMPGVPTLYTAMINHPKLAKYDLSALKFCISGGAPLPIEVKKEFEEITGCDLVEGYGLSETSPVATCNPINGPVKKASIGIPFPGTRVSIRSLEDPTIEMPLGEKGEICIAGPQVMKGYWNKPEETANTFTEEFFRTGDVGYMDDDGFIFIVDRIKDLIICSGFNIYPRRVEEAIYEFPAVEEVNVVGIPDNYRGEAPKAFIKLKQGQTATKQEILTFLKPKISKLEMPADIEFRDELPKTMIGKLSKKELRETPDDSA